MTVTSNGVSTIIRTERGLSIAGTRITLYDIMDYVTAQYPPKFIRSLFDLTDEQPQISHKSLAKKLKGENKWNALMNIVTNGYHSVKRETDNQKV
jgi:hypothetical protein